MERFLPTIEYLKRIDRRSHKDGARLWFSVICGSIVIHALFWWLLWCFLLEKHQVEAKSHLQLSVALVEIPATAGSESKAESVLTQATKSSTESEPKVTESLPQPRNTQKTEVRQRKTPADFLQPAPIDAQKVLTESDGVASVLDRVQRNKAQQQSQEQEKANVVSTKKTESKTAKIKRAPAINPDEVLVGNKVSGQVKGTSRDKIRRAPVINPDEVLPSNTSSGEDSDAPNVSPSPTNEGQLSRKPGTTQVGSGFSATITKLRLSQPDRDVPDKQAQPKQSNKQLAAIDYLTPLGLSLERDLVLATEILIDNQGKPNVMGIRVEQGNLDRNVARKLAQEIIEPWEFEPTYMAGKPVYQSYLLTLIISPK